jgi:quinol-cytochrome oxidoreductase complex cytochrome b subunit
MARQQLPLRGCLFFTLHAMPGSPMFSEPKTDLKLPTRRIAGEDLRLSPVQPRNTLLTVIFFSAVALAIGYWIFFPPAGPATPETTAAPTAQSSPADPSKSKDPIGPN